ncbi:hypothetical protein P7C73_g935, partial [Tremellales sp. Uapishka_1]
MCPANLQDFPDEILTRIATQLDLSDCQALSVTCSRVRDAAEARIWRSILLTTHHVIAWSKKDTLFLSQTYGNRGSAVPPSRIRAPRYIQYLLDGLRERPARKGFVRHLLVDMVDPIPMETIELLDFTSGGLVELNLRATFSPPDDARTLSPLQLFQSMSFPLVSLKSLSMYLADEWEDTLCEALKRAPRLERLRLEGVRGLRMGSAVVQRKKKILQLPGLLHLRELFVERMRGPLSETLAQVIENSPSLENVALRDYSFDWHPNPADRLLTALGGVERLSELRMTAPSLASLAKTGFPPALKVLSVVCGTQEVDDILELLPLIPGLQQVQLNISMVDRSLVAGRWEVSQSGQMIHPFSTARRAFLSGCKSLIRQTTVLHTVHCPNYIYRQDDYIPDEQDVNFTGIRVYGYRNGTDELVHCRTIFGDDADDRELEEAGETVWCNGIEIPFSVLRAIYSASGISLGDLKAGRDGRLPEAGWEVLRFCKLQQ